MEPIDLHLVSWDRPQMTELVIRTIRQNTKLSSHRLVVWDNGSRESTQQLLKELHDNALIDELILCTKNHGLEYARDRLLLEHTRSEYFICIDNDCLPEPMEDGKDWVERLYELMLRYEDFAAISCRTQVMIGTGNIFEEADLDGSDIVEFPHPGGSMRIMNTMITAALGGWDREADGRGAEERYICGKLRDAGYRTGFAVKINCLHLFGTRGDNGTDRWGYDKDLSPEDTGHSDIHHPVLINGDDFNEIEKYAGKELTDAYRSNSK